MAAKPPRDAARRALVEKCLTLPGVYEDYPFDDDNWTVIRHRHNRKIFAWIYRREGRLWVNLKCEPLRADFLRRQYRGVTPGYHMNKVHWNTVDPAGDVPEEELGMMLSDSWRLTGGKG